MTALATVRLATSLHESTVRRAGELTQPRRRRSARTTSRSGRVREALVDARVLATALRLADYDARRLRLISATEVLVVNR